MHTNNSDGELSVKELMNLCKNRKLKYISITDHDTTKGIKEELIIGKELNIKIIPGIEISTKFENIGSVHILGYFPFEEIEEIEKYFKNIQNERYDRCKKIILKLKENGILIDYNRVLEISGKASPGRPHIAKALIENGYVKEFKEAFDKYLGEDRLNVPLEKPLNSVEMIEYIHKHKGISVLAHPWCYKNSKELIKILVEYKYFIYRNNLDGIECYGSSRDYYPIAEQYNLLKFVGSDYHAIKGHVEVLPGGNEISDEDAENLYNIIKLKLLLE